MGTREVYEEKLKRGNLYHDPTIKPGLGSARCPRCLSLLNSNSKSGEWVITPVLHDFTAVAGSGIGGLLSAIHGFNTGIPFVQRHVKGPKWLPFVIGLPPLLMFSAASATFGERTSNMLKSWVRRAGTKSQKRWWRSCIWGSVWKERHNRCFDNRSNSIHKDMHFQDLLNLR
nr:uncharacterized protein LOC101256223 isoform X1 [Solanum lycopersicum]XP_025888536.1 uncharacterized protein LOC101256223 isoform X1 [Solanum lycopersicum]XP_025888537.1 uncharacterized protein LOC101256223 isoform X1 [Solanum lycopersicum]XP_025888540.1 uncharacterized protein LOC101256223 isoform X1 [Solanum lycopersicum]XP_025888541.1 uncharacterized protein LOC101256223 isoform X1 [Solanum lycopersicum]XP_025888542.1 uncharacterized protein LOC101256223 isoform X1 [Solanum lycopersicum]